MEFIQPLKFLLLKNLPQERIKGSVADEECTARGISTMDCGEPCLWQVGAAEGQLEGLGPKVRRGGGGVARLPLSAGGGSIISWSLPFFPQGVCKSARRPVRTTHPLLGCTHSPLAAPGH